MNPPVNQPGARTFITVSLEETHDLGYKTGLGLQHGCVIALNGELGSGKTAFVQGLARGLGVPPTTYITSPSYTLINQYAGRLTLYHLDLYRLETLGDLEYLGLDEMLEPGAVLAIEWASRLPQDYLKAHLSITITCLDADARRIELMKDER